MKKIITIFLFAIFLVGCGQDSKQDLFKNIKKQKPSIQKSSSFSYHKSYDAGKYEGQKSLDIFNKEASKARKSSRYFGEKGKNTKEKTKFIVISDTLRKLSKGNSTFYLDSLYDQNKHKQRYRVITNGKEVYNETARIGTQYPYKSFIFDDTGWWLSFIDEQFIDGIHSFTNVFVHNGKQQDYFETFSLDSFQGKTFYFFKKSKNSKISYYLDGKIYETNFDQIIHDRCCEPAAYNLQISTDGKIVFWGVIGDKFSLNEVILPGFEKE